MTYTLTGLDGKVAVVTGAGRMRSIGRPIAVELARAGCDIVLTGTGRSPDRYPDEEKAAGWRDIESVADEIRALGRRATAMVSDVSDVNAVEALADAVFAEYGRADIVINNAGSARGVDRVPVVDLPLDVWHNVININLHGTFFMSRTFAQRLIAQGQGGSIVNISSIGGKLMPASAAAERAHLLGDGVDVAPARLLLVLRVPLDWAAGAGEDHVAAGACELHRDRTSDRPHAPGAGDHCDLAVEPVENQSAHALESGLR